jgi:mannose-6-phosphate isomerase-like protein (cupin superfamily)
MDVRTIADRAPRVEHEGTTTVWWMYDAREAFDETTGGGLEFLIEQEIAAGAPPAPGSRSAHQYYYVLAGHGLMNVGAETREVAPGDLVSVPPDTIHAIAPVSEHAPVRFLAYAVSAPSAAPLELPDAPSERLDGALYRSTRAIMPVRSEDGTRTTWWLVEPGELAGITAGGFLELTNEWEVAGGGAVHRHAHPTYEFYYGLTGRGVMTLDDEDREVGPGDLVLIPPDVPHSIRPIGDHAPIRCFCFAVGLAGARAYDYANDHAAAG